MKQPIRLLAPLLATLLLVGAPLPVSGFSARGPLVSTDMPPVAPSGATALQKTTAADPRNFVLTSPKAFGAVGDGVADDSGAINAWLNYIVANGGGTYIWTPGVYRFASQVTLARPVPANITILASGVTIKTTGAISGLTITGSDPPYGVRIVGLMVDDTNNASATAGFEQIGTSLVTWDGCVVIASRTSPTFAAWYLHQTNVNDNTTSNFWTRFPGSAVRSAAGFIPIGVLLEGSDNATDFYGFFASGVTDAIKLIPPVGGTYGLSNGLTVVGGWYEGVVNAVRVVGSAGQRGTYGLIVEGNRFEDVSGHVLSLEGATVNTQQPPYVGPNTLIQNVSGLINNPKNLYVSQWALFSGNRFGPDKLNNAEGYVFTGTDATADVLTVNSFGGGSGFVLSFVGTPVFTQRPIAGDFVQLGGANSWLATFTGVAGLSGTATVAKNMRGSCAFAGAATCVAAFPYFHEADAGFTVTVTGNVNETFWVTGKARTGFTIHSSNARSRAVADWHLIR